MIMDRKKAYDLTVSSVTESWFNSVENACKEGLTKLIIRDIHVKEDILLKVIKEFTDRNFTIEIFNNEDTQCVLISWE